MAEDQQQQQQSTPWYQGAEGVDAELIGHLQTRGWDKLDPIKAAAAAAKSHREAEKLIGVPANQLLRLPADINNADGMKEVWARLGKPADAKGYDISGVKRGDKPLDERTQDFIRNTAFAANMPKDAATRLAQEFVKHQENVEASAAAERAAKISEQRNALEANWGANKAANMVVARNAAKALGVTEEHIAALEGVVGYDKVMEMFRQIGSKIGEDKFITSDNNPNGVMTREQAVAKKAMLQKDEAWVKRYMNGGSEEAREMAALIRIITNDGQIAA